MKILFLDIDGVLCLYKKDKKLSYCVDENNVVGIHNHLDLDANCCVRLKTILNQTKTKIVLSSSWRLLDERSQSKLFGGLTLYKIFSFYFIGSTPFFPKKERL